MATHLMFVVLSRDPHGLADRIGDSLDKSVSILDDQDNCFRDYEESPIVNPDRVEIALCGGKYEQRAMWFREMEEYIDDPRDGGYYRAHFERMREPLSIVLDALSDDDILFVTGCTDETHLYSREQADKSVNRARFDALASRVA